jgi:hypothetical protein
VSLNNPRQLRKEQDTRIQAKKYTVEGKRQPGEEEKIMCTADTSMNGQCREKTKYYCIKTLSEMYDLTQIIVKECFRKVVCWIENQSGLVESFRKVCWIENPSGLIENGYSPLHGMRPHPAGLRNTGNSQYLNEQSTNPPTDPTDRSMKQSI